MYQRYTVNNVWTLPICAPTLAECVDLKLKDRVWSFCVSLFGFLKFEFFRPRFHTQYCQTMGSEDIYR
jgi:hypothetical protein